MHFSIGAVISQGLTIYLKNFLSFTLLATLAYTPLAMLYALMLSGSIAVSSALLVVTGVIAAVLDYFIAAVLIHATFSALTGAPQSLRRSLGTAMRRLVPVLGTAIVVGLIVGVATLALIVPGLIAMCVLWVAVPATVVDRTGIMDSLSRSHDLTAGNRWAIFAIVLLLALPAGIGDFVVERGFEHGDISAGSYLVSQLVIGIVMGALNAIVAAVGYFRLRQDKEAIELHAIASAFE